jgi:hypothetical protein
VEAKIAFILAYHSKLTCMAVFYGFAIYENPNYLVGSVFFNIGSTSKP